MVEARLVGVVVVGVLAACTEPLKAPLCTPVPFDTASVSADTVTTTSGLRFMDVAAGGAPVLRSCRTVAVHYDAYLLDSTKFDSSRDRGVPLTFVPGVGDLIDGFEQGVIGMGVGGKRRLIIPPALGYGSQPVRDGTGAIIVPGNATLVFDVEVIQIAP